MNGTTLNREIPRMRTRTLSSAEKGKSKNFGYRRFREIRKNWHLEKINTLQERKLFFYDINNNIIQIEDITTSDVPTISQKITRLAKNKASSFVVAQNAMDGNFFPSFSDVDTMKEFKSAGKIAGVPMIDYLIISKNGYFSYANAGLIRNRVFTNT